MVMLNCRLICQTSVVKLQLQVKLSQAVQMDLNRIAETAEPKTFERLRYVLRDTAIALLRQPDYCISCWTSVIIPKFTRAAALQCFDTLVVRESAGCDKETIFNVGKIKTQSIASQRSTDDPHNDYVVVTILLVAEGKHSEVAHYH
ncbi:hypothetical protein ACLB2K_040439 [Fragaria x ananassa]